MPTTTRRDLLTAALTTTAGVAVTAGQVRAEERDHDHEHQAAPSDPALRVKALESLMVAKGLVDRAALDALIDTYEHKVELIAFAQTHEDYQRGTRRKITLVIVARSISAI
jgi:hypothetical protein